MKTDLINEINEEFKELLEQEKLLSKKRKQLHLKIDKIKASLVKDFQNIENEISEETVIAAIMNISNQEKLIPGSLPVSGKREAAGEKIMEFLEDKLSRKKNELKILQRDEALLSFERRVLHGKIDILKTQLERYKLDAGTKKDMKHQKDLDKLVKDISRILSENF